MNINRNAQLDGWRGFGMLMVLLGHLFPLGGQAMQLTVPKFGMCFLLAMSGYLVTSIAYKRPDDVGGFLIKRLLRVIPLAWLTIVIALIWEGSTDPYQWVSHLFGFANVPFRGVMPLIVTTGHLWSFCAQSWSYVFIAIVLVLGGRKGLWVLPMAALLITWHRIMDGQLDSIRTEYRLDEVFAGSSLALVIGRDDVKNFFRHLNPYLVLCLLFASCRPEVPWLQYARPYISVALVGWTVTNDGSTWMARQLEHKYLAQIATYSYAIYCLHPLLSHTWLGSDELLGHHSVLLKYAKRPLLLTAIGLASWLSTQYYERWFLSLPEKLKVKRQIASNHRVSA